VYLAQLSRLTANEKDQRRLGAAFLAFLRDSSNTFPGILFSHSFPLGTVILIAFPQSRSTISNANHCLKVPFPLTTVK
jgi:hypothetical protein